MGAKRTNWRIQGVGRHFLMALEQGKQSCEVELVLRTLETLGFEMLLSP